MSSYDRLLRELGGSDAYAVLGVSRRADHAEIRRAYRAMVRAHHPDSPASQGPASVRTIQLVTASRELLEKWRDDYDARQVASEPDEPDHTHTRLPPPPETTACFWTVPTQQSPQTQQSPSTQVHAQAQCPPRARIAEPAAADPAPRPHSHRAQRVRDHLVLSIVATILCAPIGAVGLVHAIRTADLLTHGDVEAARQRSRLGRTWSWTGAVIGAILVSVLSCAGGHTPG
ncbi:CD225/dispanin family protein [Frankia sp. AgKG'84/4]|uniref:CD225/dispanin family protein n=1 Tax=Frankia sp. AgKG'84/4 TaxID=573490 RepID=UPI00200BD6B0|nr:CD225/dispanin family protein [Frankia sp. AgKG'84/4]MCL9796432.1 CD225/dispanin family protein [Frankia sp. AgKG'84/4]